MTAILGGLGAAIMWATATLCSSRASRQIGASSVVSWMMLVGLAVVGPVAAVQGVPEGLDREATVLLVIAAFGNIVGLLLVYSAFRIGKVGIIAPISSTEGAVAALIAVAAGETIGRGEGVMLVVITIGIVLAGATGIEAEGLSIRRHVRAVAYAIGAACCFGIGLYASGRVGRDVPISWVLLPARLLGVVAVALPLIATRKLVLTRKAAPLVLTSGLVEVVGFASFTLGARDSLPVSAVLASQFAGVAAIVAFVLFRERLLRIQVVGISAIGVGVAILSALHA